VVMDIASGARIPPLAPNGTADCDEPNGLRFKRPFARVSDPRIPPLVCPTLGERSQAGALASKAPFKRSVVAPCSLNARSRFVSRLFGSAEEGRPKG
jgi:hypothetical protein